MDLPFHTLTPADEALVRPHLAAHPQNISGYSWGSLIAWRDVFRYRVHFITPDTLLIAYEFPGGAALRMLQPVGDLSPDAQRHIIEMARRMDRPLEIDGVTEAFVARHPEFVSRFELRWDRDYANYVYAAEDLALLAGRRFSKKRNLISQARHGYEWTVEHLAPGEVVDHCLEVCRAVANEKVADESQADAEWLKMELDAMAEALRRFAALGFEGIVLRVAGQIAGFAIFEPISSDTVLVHFEKADRHLKGIYQVLNQETSRVLHERGYKWINREDDLGNAGLRQAKESYHPVRLEPFGRMVFKG